MEGGDNSSQEKATEEPPKRGRGRPRKEKPEEPEDAEPKPKRPRGRPKGSFKKTRPTEEKPKGPRGRPRKSPESPKKPEKKKLMVSNACPSQPENNYIGLNVTEAEPTCAEDNNTTASLNVPLSTDSTRSRLQVIPRQKIKPDDLTRMQYEVMVEQKKKLQEQTTFYRLMNRKLRIEMGLPNKD